MPDSTTTVNLKPCPFCGETPTLTKHHTEDMYRLTHKCCVVSPILVPFDGENWDTAEAVAKTWNTRSE